MRKTKFEAEMMNLDGLSEHTASKKERNEERKKKERKRERETISILGLERISAAIPNSKIEISFSDSSLGVCPSVVHPSIGWFNLLK